MSIRNNNVFQMSQSKAHNQPQPAVMAQVGTVKTLMLKSRIETFLSERNFPSTVSVSEITQYVQSLPGMRPDKKTAWAVYYLLKDWNVQDSSKAFRISDENDFKVKPKVLSSKKAPANMKREAVEAEESSESVSLEGEISINPSPSMKLNLVEYEDTNALNKGLLSVYGQGQGATQPDVEMTPATESRGTKRTVEPHYAPPVGPEGAHSASTAKKLKRVLATTKQPVPRRQSAVEHPTITFADCGGMESVIEVRVERCLC